MFYIALKVEAGRWEEAMLRAFDDNNRDVYIDDSKSDVSYHCPICERPVFRKIGNGVRRPHFAHNWGEDNVDSVCDGWHYDMSDWHRNWQERFPAACREVVVSCDGKRHRADILIEKRKLVVEFQHSSLSAEEYAERNRFYSECGYHVIWLFDMTDDFNTGHLVPQEKGEFLWRRPKSAFRSITINNGDDVVSYAWDSNVEAVFFENGRLISKVSSYNASSKRLFVKSIEGVDGSFEWSEHTFTAFLNDIYVSRHIIIPECPKCHIPMMLKRFQESRDYFWGCRNYYYKDRNSCREIVWLKGFLPSDISVDGKCPYCKMALDATTERVKCNNCGFTVIYSH